MRNWSAGWDTPTPEPGEQLPGTVKASGGVGGFCVHAEFFTGGSAYLCVPVGEPLTPQQETDAVFGQVG